MHSLVDAVALGRARPLGLMARRVVDGYLAGHHASPRPGEGVELVQFRPYEPGDDPRRVDWRAYARSDRFIVRESEVERDIVVRFVLDASASMGVAAPGGTKLDAARGILATLALLAERQGDRVALHVAGEGRGHGTVGSGRGLSTLLGQLEGLEAGGRWGDHGLVRAGMPPRRRRDLVVVVSDLFQDGTEIEEDLGRLAAVGHDGLILHLLTRAEHDLEVPRHALFRDVETGRVLAASRAGLRAGYLASRDAELARWRRLAVRYRFQYRLVLVDDPMADWLPALLRDRRRGGPR